MLVKVYLVDINPKMIKAWRETFEECPEVEIVQGSMLTQPVSAWVTPTNSGGRMDGGLDLAIKNFLGQQVETGLQQEIQSRYRGQLPVGHAICQSTRRPQPAYLISTPTMVSSSENVGDTLNVALACAAAFQAVNQQNEAQPGSIRSVALPGLGANTGKVPVEICADLMWSGFSLFRRRSFADFNELRAALQAELGDLGPVSGQTSVPKIPLPQAGSLVGSSSFLPGSLGKSSDIDFDDSEGSPSEDDAW